MERPNLLRRHLVSVFVLLNLTAVTVLNYPTGGIPVLDQVVTRYVSPQVIYRFKLIAYRLHQYANLTGLDPHWEMFSHVKGEDWRYLIEGLDEKGWRVLPLPGQGPRTLGQRLLFDFKEGKFSYTSAADPRGYRTYGAYLCRKGQSGKEARLIAVRISVQYQRILEQREALSLGRHFDPQIRTFPLARLACS